MIWHNISEERIKPDDFLAVIEIPKGSKNKYELDKQSGYLILDRVLYTSTHYPANYGFIPRTHTEDFDPLDVLVLCSEPIVPMAMVRCYPIGVINMMDSGELDSKILAVPFEDPSFRDYKSVDDLPHHMVEEYKHFFTVYKNLEGKKTAIMKVGGVMEAKDIISESIAEYRRIFYPGR